MVSLKYFASAFLLTSAALADDGVVIYHKADIIVNTCQSTLTKAVLLFNATIDKAGYCNVKNQQALGSMATCLMMSKNDQAIDTFIDRCSKYNLTEEQFKKSYENATKYLVTNLTANANFKKGKLFYSPVKISPKTLQGAFDSNIGRWYNYNRANYYGWVLLSYWFLLILLAGACRLVSFVAPKTVASFNGKFSNIYRKYISMPALFKQKKVAHGSVFKYFEFIIPSRLETIQIFVYFVLTVAFNVANFHHDSPNSIWVVQSAEMGRKIADRTGIMVLYIIPQLILFAGRNNFTRWISGWSFARFNIIHHWMGRIVTILCIVHAVGMTYNGKGIGKYDSRNKKPYVRWGYVATVAAGLMCFHSLAILRKKRYEIFVLSHNVLAIIFVMGAWIHVEDDGFQQFTIAATAVWAFDKVLRLVRMSWFGVKTADVQLIANETLKVRVPKPSSWKPYPLCHAYIYFFRPTCFWQSHPFTVVYTSVDAEEISFYIKVKGGVSHGLYKYLSTQPDQRANIKCSVEGPYGQSYPLQHYESLVFFAGGNGIPGLFSSAVELYQKKTSKSQNVKLYWVIRHWKSMEWFYNEFLSLKDTNVKPIVYVTNYDTKLDQDFVEKYHMDQNSSSSEKDIETKNSTDNVERLMEVLDFVEFRSGRPNIEEVIQQEISEAGSSMAVVACGHDQFVDSTRKAVVDNLPDGKRIDFIDTMEVW